MSVNLFTDLKPFLRDGKPVMIPQDRTSGIDRGQVMVDPEGFIVHRCVTRAPDQTSVSNTKGNQSRTRITFEEVRVRPNGMMFNLPLDPGSQTVGRFEGIPGEQEYSLYDKKGMRRAKAEDLDKHQEILTRNQRAAKERAALLDPVEKEIRQTAATASLVTQVVAAVAEKRVSK